eukprot:s4077_g9.t1
MRRNGTQRGGLISNCKLQLCLEKAHGELKIQPMISGTSGNHMQCIKSCTTLSSLENDTKAAVVFRPWLFVGSSAIQD